MGRTMLQRSILKNGKRHGSLVLEDFEGRYVIATFNRLPERASAGMIQGGGAFAGRTLR